MIYLVQIALVIISIVLVPVGSHAGVMADATRLIYPEGKREKSMMVVNTNNYPVILQAWIDRGEGVPSNSTPFIVIPPILRLSSGAIQGLRVLYDGAQLPTDRESVFWLNLYEIPPLEGKVQDVPKVALAMNTQLKIFYRPKAILPRLESISDALKVSVLKKNSHKYISFYNSSGFYISVASIQVGQGGDIFVINPAPDSMIYPKGKSDFILPSAYGGDVVRVILRYINDGGFEDEAVFYVN